MGNDTRPKLSVRISGSNVLYLYSDLMEAKPLFEGAEKLQTLRLRVKQYLATLSPHTHSHIRSLPLAARSLDLVVEFYPMAQQQQRQASTQVSRAPKRASRSPSEHHRRVVSDFSTPANTATLHPPMPSLELSTGAHSAMRAGCLPS